MVVFAGLCYVLEGVTDCQGILGNVTLGGTVLRDWRITSFPLNQPARLHRYTTKALRATAASPEERVRLGAVLARSAGSLTIWAGEFQLDAHQLRDTFLALPGWGKGVAFINQLHLGTPFAHDEGDEERISQVKLRAIFLGLQRERY